MTRLMVGMRDSVLVIESSNTGWNSRESLKGTQPQSIAFDPLNSGRVYCATFGNGLWRSDDNGETWSNIGKDVISSPYVMSVAVSSLKSDNGFNKVYSGTEPSAVYTSSDGGDTWKRMKTLDDLPSSKSWSFPPRPWTHHVRWIEPDANNPDFVFAAIEAGALVQSHDGGKTWIDRNRQGPYDTHTLATHSKAPRRLYSSAGDGYYESYDYGETWTRPMENLRHGYLFGIAVDSGNPEAVIVSASNGPSRSYVAENAETFVYRRDASNSNGWKTVTNGLPEPKGSTMMSFTSNTKTPGEFYGVNNRGLFLSTDAGNSWKRLDTFWPREYLQQWAWAIAINE
jgi:photosystem II stability/assembly factor-like uncharacterized protein